MVVLTDANATLQPGVLRALVAIERLLRDPQEAARLGSRGRQQLEEDAPSRVTVTTAVAIYRDLGRPATAG